jgi:hypothetical protein
VNGDEAHDANRRARKLRLSRLASGPRVVVRFIFTVLQRISRSRAEMLDAMRIILAGLTAIALIYELDQVFGFAVWSAISCGVVGGIVTWLVNSICVTRVALGEKGVRHALINTFPAIVIAMPIGVALSFAVTTQLSHSRVLREWVSPAGIEIAYRENPAIRNHERSSNDSENDVRGLARTNVDEDRKAAQLLTDYQKTKSDLDEVDGEYKCIGDDRCVTRKSKETFLDELGRRRNELKLGVDSAKRNLDIARQEIRTAIDKHITDALRNIDTEREIIGQLKQNQARINDFEPSVHLRLASFAVLLILYLLLHILPVLFSKDEIDDIQIKIYLARKWREADRDKYSDIIADEKSCADNRMRSGLDVSEASSQSPASDGVGVSNVMTELENNPPRRGVKSWIPYSDLIKRRTSRDEDDAAL